MKYQLLYFNVQLHSCANISCCNSDCSRNITIIDIDIVYYIIKKRSYMKIFAVQDHEVYFFMLFIT